MAETWNSWRNTLPAVDTTQHNQINPGQDRMESSNLDDLIDDPSEGTTEPDTVVTPTPAQLTSDQLEQILNRQNDQFQAQQRETMQMLGQQMNPPPRQDNSPVIEMPDPREMQRAMDDGDSARFMELMNQRDAAIDLSHRQQLQGVTNAAVQRFDELNNRYIEQQPEFKRHRPEVEALMEEINMPASLRNQPNLVAILVDAVKGRNIDKEVDERIETRRRQRQQTPTGEPTSTRQVRSNVANPEPVFSNEAFEALRMAGRSPDRHAQTLGYADWAAYERATQEKYNNWDDMNIPAWRRRMNSGRTA